MSAVKGSAVDSVFEREVLSLHRYLEGWLKGKIGSEGDRPVRLERVLAADFVVIHPTGKRDEKAGVIRNFMAAHGEKPAGYALQIQDVVVETLPGGYCLATYKESHRGEPGRTRLCRALLRLRSQRNDVEWLYLHETFAGDIP